MPQIGTSQIDFDKSNSHFSFYTHPDAVLDNAGDETAGVTFWKKGTVTYQYELSNVGTNVQVVILNSLDGVNFHEVATVSTRTENKVYKEEFTGLLGITKLLLKSINGGTPSLNNIATGFTR